MIKNFDVIPRDRGRALSLEDLFVRSLFVFFLFVREYHRVDVVLPRTSSFSLTPMYFDVSMCRCDGNEQLFDTLTFAKKQKKKNEN